MSGSAQASSEEKKAAEMKAIVAKCTSAHAAMPKSRIFQLKTGKWNKEFSSDHVVTYDIKRTDSLVSPLVAVISINGTRFFDQPKETEAEAYLIEFSQEMTAMRTKVTIKYAYQDTGWVMKSASANTAVKPFGRTSFGQAIDYDIRTEDLKEVDPLRSCVTQM